MIDRLIMVNAVNLPNIVKVSIDDCLVAEVEAIATVSRITTEAMNNIVTTNIIKHEAQLQRLRAVSAGSFRLQTIAVAFLSKE